MVGGWSTGTISTLPLSPGLTATGFVTSNIVPSDAFIFNVSGSTDPYTVTWQKNSIVQGSVSATAPFNASDTFGVSYDYTVDVLRFIFT